MTSQKRSTTISTIYVLYCTFIMTTSLIQNFLTENIGSEIYTLVSIEPNSQIGKSCTLRKGNIQLIMIKDRT